MPDSLPLEAQQKLNDDLFNKLNNFSFFQHGEKIQQCLDAGVHPNSVNPNGTHTMDLAGGAGALVLANNGADIGPYFYRAMCYTDRSASEIMMRQALAIDPSLFSDKLFQFIRDIPGVDADTKSHAKNYLRKLRDNPSLIEAELADLKEKGFDPEKRQAALEKLGPVPQEQKPSIDALQAAEYYGTTYHAAHGKWIPGT